MFRCVLVLLVALVSLSPVICRAQAEGAVVSQDTDPAGYAALVAEALGEYDRGHFAEARTLFLRAHELFPNARTYRALGMVEFELRNYVASATHLEQALNSDVRALNQELRREIEGLLGRARGFIALVRVRLSPTDVVLRLDGAPVDLSQADGLRLAAGEHVLEVEAKGYAKETRRVKTEGGAEQAITIVLRKRETEPNGARPLYRNPWLWTGVGAVVVGVVAGSLYAVSSGDTKTEAANGGSTNAILVGPTR